MITLRYLFRWICKVVTQLSVLIVVLSPSRERRQSILSKTRNWRKCHVKKYFSRFAKIFWILERFSDCTLFWIFIKFVCESMNLNRIWNCFLDLTNFSKAIFSIKKIPWDSEYFFGSAKYFWIVPFRLPYRSIWVICPFLTTVI